MTADPKPKKPVVNLDSYRAIVQTNPDGPILPGLFELQGRMAGVILQGCEISVRERFDGMGELGVEFPEIRRGEMLQISEQFPAL
ncbi:MAG: hypothetical protein OHK006_07990 [Thermodesulfovibrionales bacterium]